ncbi:MAG: hypothetical protein MUF26_06010 [Syntrophales bacterium]|nr:hypothetical protein [Syntrophales bacterium]
MKRQLMQIAMVFAFLSAVMAWPAVQYLPESAVAAADKSSGVPSLNLIIEKIYLKADKIFVTIVRNPGGQLDPHLYPGIKLKVDSGLGKPPKQWSLNDVDRTRVLLAPGGRVEFSTGITLDRQSMVKAMLSYKSWSTTKAEIIKQNAAASSSPSEIGNKEVILKKTEPTMMKAQKARPAIGIQRKITPFLDETGGIRVTPPVRGASFAPGARVDFNALFLNDVPAGDLKVELKQMSANAPLGVLAVPSFDPRPDRMSFSGTWPLPSSGLPSGSDYYLFASHDSGAWGMSDNFSIVSAGEGLIRVLNPRGSYMATPGAHLNVDYQFTRSVGAGTTFFELFKIDADGRHGRAVLSTTQAYRPGPAGNPEPIRQLRWTLPSDLTVGRYFVLITHPEARGQSREIKARIQATGGNAADYLDITTLGWGTRRELIRPSQITEVVVATLSPEQNHPSCGFFWEVSIHPNAPDANESNNSLRKFVPIDSQYGGEIRVHNAHGGKVTVPCNPRPGTTGYSRNRHGGVVHAVLRNCTAELLSIANFSMSVSQTYMAPAERSGSGSGGYLVTEWVEASQPAHWQYLYNLPNCGTVGVAGPSSSTRMVNPGECAFIHIQLDKESDGKLTFEFRGVPATWQGLRNPYVVDVDFGHWATTVGGGQGQTWQCVYGP